jgi:hypothetical protein
MMREASIHHQECVDASETEGQGKRRQRGRSEVRDRKGDVAL